MTAKRTCLHLSLSAALLALLAPAEVDAAGFQLKENSAQGLGRAFAGSAADPGDPAVIANNPAAMSLIDGRVAQFDLSLVDLSVRFQGEGVDALGRPLQGGQGGDGGDLAAIPAAYFSAPITDRLRLGASLSAPFGLKTEYEDGWVGRYQALTSELTTINLGLALSWQIDERFSVGGSLVHQYADATLSNAIDFGAILAAEGLAPAFSPQSADGTVTVTGDDRAWGWTVGALWSPDPRTRVGVHYRARIRHTLDGQAAFEVPEQAAAVFAQLPGNLFTDTGGRAALSTPAVATLSVHHQASDRLALMGDLARTYWDSFDAIRVEFDNPAQEESVDAQGWRNTWFTSVGAEYRIDPRWTLRGGLAYDQTPTNRELRSPRVPDTSRRWVSLGVGYRPSPAWMFNAGYTRLLVNRPEISNRAETGSTLSGDIGATTNLFAVSATYHF